MFLVVLTELLITYFLADFDSCRSELLERKSNAWFFIVSDYGVNQCFLTLATS